MEHQDWKTIYVKSNKQPDNKKQKQQSQSNNFEKKMEEKIENGNMRNEKIDKDKSLSIQQKRQSKGLTQKRFSK